MKNKINFVTGESYTLAEFFSGNRRIVIPDLQRDYCWGDKTHTNERKELVSGFIDTLVNHYKNYRMEIDKLSLGLIYGYEVPANHIQLCDGQQRMTTLFLLLGMLNKKSTENFFQSLLISDYELSDDKEPYLQYSVRETSLYFLSDLVCHFFIRNAKDNDYVEKVSDIWHGTWFFNEYRTDPSIRSMISALEIIENLLKDKDETWCCQFGDFLINRLTFLYYDMETRKNGEETFVVINTTGEPLSSTQNLKPLVVQADKNKYFEATHHKTPAIAWEEIETWFWKNREPKSNDTADAGFAEFLRWISIIELTKKGGSSDVVRTILSKGKYSFNYNEISLETILNYWETIKRLFPENGGEFTNEKSFLSPSDNDFYADTGKYKLKALSQIECFRLLPVIAYCNNNGCDLTDRNALRLYHFVDNLSRIENIQKNVNPLVEEAISIALTCTDIIELLQQENQDKFSKSILTEEEIDKLRILDNNPSRNDIEEEFWYAQKHPILQGEILPLIEWTKLNGSFNIANFKTIRSHFEQIFPRGTKAVTDLTRRSLLTYGLPEYPRGNSFGYSAEEWKGIICANSKKIGEYLDTLFDPSHCSPQSAQDAMIEDYKNNGNKNDLDIFIQHDFLMEYCDEKRFGSYGNGGIMLYKNKWAKPYSVENALLLYKLNADWDCYDFDNGKALQDGSFWRIWYYPNRDSNCVVVEREYQNTTVAIDIISHMPHKQLLSVFIRNNEDATKNALLFLVEKNFEFSNEDGRYEIIIDEDIDKFISYIYSLTGEIDESLERIND